MSVGIAALSLAWLLVPGTGQAAEGADPAPTKASAPPAPPPSTANCADSVTAELKSGAFSTATEKALAQASPQLVTCLAVKADSDKLCKVLTNERAASECRGIRSTFHELKQRPKARAFVFNDEQMAGCKKFKPLTPYCDRFREATRSGDESQCAQLGEVASICKALITLDKSLCTAPTGAGFEGHDEHSQDTYGQMLARDCVAQIERMGPYAQGLKGLAESNSPDSELAKAALGEANACGGLAPAATAACAKPVEAPAPNTKPSPAAPAAAADKPAQ